MRSELETDSEAPRLDAKKRKVLGAQQPKQPSEFQKTRAKLKNLQKIKQLRVKNAKNKVCSRVSLTVFVFI